MFERQSLVLVRPHRPLQHHKTIAITAAQSNQCHISPCVTVADRCVLDRVSNGFIINHGRLSGEPTDLQRARPECSVLIRNASCVDLAC